MGHVVNPISFRITKSTYWQGTWASLTSINFMNFFIENLMYSKFITWFLAVLNLQFQNLHILSSKMINLKNFIILNISLVQTYMESNIFTLENFKVKKKKKKKSSIFFFTYLINSYKVKKTYFLMHRKTSYRKWKIKFKQYSYGFFSFWIWCGRNLQLKNFFFNALKKENVVRLFPLTAFIAKYRILASIFIKLGYSVNHLRFYEYFSIFFNKYKRISYNLKKNSRSYLKHQFFFRIKKYLNYFLNLIFRKQKQNTVDYRINFFFEKNYKNSTLMLAHFIKQKVKQGYFIGNAVRKVLNMIVAKHGGVLGYKLYFSGRYAKKLRNMPETYQQGQLALSTASVPLSYYQINILTRIGIIGLKIWIVKKNKYYEII